MKRSLDPLVMRLFTAGILSLLLCAPFYRYLLQESVEAMWMNGYAAWQMSPSTAGPLVFQAVLFALCSFAALMGISLWLGSEIVRGVDWLQDRPSRKDKAEAATARPGD